MKIKIFFGVLLLLMLNVVIASAQGIPCGGDDPDATCPLDAWVIVLAAFALILATIHLYRNQKSTQPLSNLPR